MNFTDRCPSTWRELQDDVALLLSQAGYQVVSPCTIETARGSVEVDVLVKSPDEFIKKIICECKYWSSPIPKEKVHAFRTVVSDSGAYLGLIISKCGFQSGSIEAAKYSNVQLLTWEQFTNLISDKWILYQLKKIKRESVPLSEYINPLHFPFELLKESDISRYQAACDEFSDLRYTCWMITKTDLETDSFSKSPRWYRCNEYTSIEHYLNFLSERVAFALQEFDEILENSNIQIDPERFEKLEGYIYMFLN
ncbi:restriction endonuclease [Anaerovoracaceae bacterium 42-11]